MASAEVLSEKEVTKEGLEAIFRRAFFATSYDKDGDLVVQTDGPRVIVMVDEKKRLIKYMAIYGVKAASPVALKHALTNRMNDEIIFARFSIPGRRPDVLVAEYFLPYEQGIPAFQIVAAVRLFSRAVPAAIHACDENDLVE